MERNPYLVIEGYAAMTAFEIYIKTTPQRVWEVLTEPEIHRKAFMGADIRSDWTPGSEYRGGVEGVGDLIEGINEEVDPPRRLVQTMRGLWDDQVRSEPPSRMVWEIEPVDDSCHVRLTHSGLGEDADVDQYANWPKVLSAMKTLLESGDQLTTPSAFRSS